MSIPLSHCQKNLRLQYMPANHVPYSICFVHKGFHIFLSNKILRVVLHLIRSRRVLGERASVRASAPEPSDEHLNYSTSSACCTLSLSSCRRRTRSSSVHHCLALQNHLLILYLPVQFHQFRRDARISILPASALCACLPRLSTRSSMHISSNQTKTPPSCSASGKAIRRCHNWRWSSRSLHCPRALPARRLRHHPLHHLPSTRRSRRRRHASTDL